MSALNPEQHNTQKRSRPRDRHTDSFRNLYISGFAENVTEDALRNKFSVFGKIRSVRIPRDLHTKQHRGYGFITFDDPESAKEAVKSELQMDGKQLRIEYAKEGPKQRTKQRYEPYPQTRYMPRYDSFPYWENRYAPHHHHPYEYPTSYPPPRDYAPHPYMVTPPPHYVPPPYNPTRRSRYDNPYLDGIRPQRDSREGQLRERERDMVNTGNRETYSRDPRLNAYRNEYKNLQNDQNQLLVQNQNHQIIHNSNDKTDQQQQGTIPTKIIQQEDQLKTM